MPIYYFFIILLKKLKEIFKHGIKFSYVFNKHNLWKKLIHSHNLFTRELHCLYSTLLTGL